MSDLIIFSILVLFLFAIVIGYVAGFKDGQKKSQSNVDKYEYIPVTFPIQERLLGDYLCVYTDPIHSCFLVTEAYHQDKLIESMLSGLLRRATPEEIEEAKKIGRI